MFRFLHKHVFTSIGSVIGWGLAVFGNLDTFRDVNALGLSPMTWAAIGATLFFVSVLTMMYRMDQDFGQRCTSIEKSVADTQQSIMSMQAAIAALQANQAAIQGGAGGFGAGGGGAAGPGGYATGGGGAHQPSGSIYINPPPGKP